MKKYFGISRLSSWLRIAGLAALMTTASQAAQFQFGALVQAGVAGGGDWEVGVGNSVASLADTNSLGTHWATGSNRLVEVEYLRSTNTASVRVYNGNTASGAFTESSFQPTGGAGVAANATWTLPAAAFFATAQGTFSGGPIFGSSISITNLVLTGVSGAVNIIQPIQQTTLTAARPVLGGTITVAQTQDIVFTADSTGSWRLQGTIQMGGLGPFFGANGDDLALSISASATDAVPEPGTVGLMLIGGLLMAGVSRRRKSAAIASVV
jgi:hypothetical protein